jgi:hypothetical protein
MYAFMVCIGAAVPVEKVRTTHPSPNAIIECRRIRWTVIIVCLYKKNSQGNQRRYLR